VTDFQNSVIDSWENFGIKTVVEVPTTPKTKFSKIAPTEAQKRQAKHPGGTEKNVMLSQ